MVRSLNLHKDLTFSHIYKYNPTKNTKYHTKQGIYVPFQHHIHKYIQHFTKTFPIVLVLIKYHKYIIQVH